MDLNQLKNKDCYKVPENYFEELPKMVFQNIAKQKRAMTIRRSVIAIASLAASILLIVGIIQLRPTTQVPLVAQVDTTAQKTGTTEVATAEAPAKQEAGIMTAQAAYTPQTATATSRKAQARPASASEESATLEDIDYQIINSYIEDLSLDDYLYVSYE